MAKVNNMIYFDCCNAHTLLTQQNVETISVLVRLSSCCFLFCLFVFFFAGVHWGVNLHILLRIPCVQRRGKVTQRSLDSILGTHFWTEKNLVIN